MCYCVMSFVLCLSVSLVTLSPEECHLNDRDISFNNYFAYINFRIHDSIDHFKHELAFNWVVYARYPSIHFIGRVLVVGIRY